MNKDFLLNEGIEAVKRKDYESAYELLKNALQYDQNNVEAWLWYARIQGDADKRLRCVERALSIDPNHPEARRLYTQIKRASKRTTGTLRAITETATVAAVSDSQSVLITKHKTQDIKRKTATTRRTPQNLGEPVTVSKLHIGSLLGRALSVLFFGGVAAWALLISDFFTAARTITDTSTIIEEPLPIIVSVVGLGSLLIAVWGLARLLLILPQGVAIKEYGLERFGLRTTRVKWRDVAEVRLRCKRNFLMGNRYRLNIRTKSGQELIIGSIFANINELIEGIIRHAGPTLGKQLGDAALSGTVLSFDEDRVEVGPQGVTRGPTLVTWADIHSVTINNKARIVVDSAYQGTIDVALHNEPNLPLVGYMARYISGRQVNLQYDL